MDSGDDVQRLAELTLDPNEASGLLRVRHTALLEHYGWDQAFWSVLDEVDVEDAIVLIGHDAGHGPQDGWAIERLVVQRAGDAGEMRDAESLSRWDRWIYIFGSHHGGKDGPIRRREQWVARFHEPSVQADESGSGSRGALEVVDTGFRLHRIVNDALQAAPVELAPMGPLTRKAFIDATLDELHGTDEAAMIRTDDWTINIEGISFTPSGSLLLGLRFPVAADGRPLLVEIDGCQGLFAQPRAWPRVERVLVVDAVGRGGDMAGVRDLCVVDDTLHLVTGDLDSAGKGSVIREDYPAGGSTVSTHFAAPLAGVDGHARVAATAVAEFPDNPRIEGIAEGPDGRFFYVSDEDDSVTVRSTPLLASGA
ncbi:MAG: hypothetical protein GEU74_00805 [Nitriliruptorales bacterium]|nr:hypothetical protein [Nitriliruptorales bacterium]